MGCIVTTSKSFSGEFWQLDGKFVNEPATTGIEYSKLCILFAAATWGECFQSTASATTAAAATTAKFPFGFWTGSGAEEEWFGRL